MKPIIKRSYFYILAACFAATSCKKLIEIPPNPSDKITTTQAFSDSSNVLNVMAGIYSSFHILDAGDAPGFYNGGIAAYTGLTADELINWNPSLLQFLTPYYKNSILPDNAYLGIMWTQGYEVIYKVNKSLDGIAASKGLSAGFIKQIGGELKTIRAFTYFNLVNIFGGVPVVTVTDFRINSRLPKETPDKVFALIVADLEEAISLLKPEYPSDGHSRPNLFTAKALLAKAYLYQKNWQKAESLSGQVIDAGLYSLESDLNSVFLTGNNEAIWQYPSIDADFLETNDGYVFIPDPDNIPEYEITPSLMDAFEADDQRKASWTNAEDVNGTIYFYPFKYKKKYMDVSPESESYVMLRLAEQYLIRAEARTQLNRLDDAAEDVNAIRQRAGLTDISVSDKETMLAAILQERRVELFCEWGNRWFDIKRTDNANLVFGTKPNWQPTDALFPIPMSEIQRNPALKQNPGY
jgi:hypothetical protein